MKRKRFDAIIYYLFIFDHLSLLIFSCQKYVRGIQKGQIRNVSFRSGKEVRRRYWPGQVLFSWNDTWRRICLSFRFVSSFLSQRVGGKKPKSVRVMNYRLACAYVRAYWSDAPRVTHTCVARSLRHRVEYNKKEREKEVEGERNEKKMVRGTEKKGRETTKSEQQVASRSKGWRNRCRAAHSRLSSSSS